MPRTLFARFNSLKVRVLGLVFLCIVASSAVIGYIVYEKVREITREQAIALLSAETRLVSQRFNDVYANIANQLHTLANTPPISGIIRARMSDGSNPNDGSTLDQWRKRLATIFQAVLRQHPEYFQIRLILAAENGKEIVRADKTALGIRVTAPERLQEKAGESYFRFGMSARSGQVVFSNITLNREEGKVDPRNIRTIRGILPIDDADGNRFGLLVINIDYEMMLRNAFRLIADRYHAVAINSAGEFMERQRNGKTEDLRLQSTEPDAPSPPPVIDAIAEATSEEGLVEVGDEVAYFFHDSGKFAQEATRMGFSLMVPRAEFYEPVSRVQKQLVFTSLVASTIFSLLAMLLARFVVNPLTSLTNQISHATRRELIETLPTDRTDEIGDIAQSFKKRAEALVDSEIRSCAIVDNVMDGLILVNDEGKIEAFNRSCERMFGYKADEIIGEHISKLMPNRFSDGEESLEEIEPPQDDDTFSGQLRETDATTKSGRTLPIEIAVCRLNLSGKTKYSGVIRDITARRELERARAEFVATVSHELRTPLTSIRGALVLIEHILPDTLPDKAMRMIEMAQKNTKRLIMLVNDILDFEKLQAQKTAFRLAYADLNHEVETAVELNGTYAQDRGVTLQADLSDRPLVATVDKERLQQVLANLISNGAKFSPGGGTVKVGVSRNGRRAQIYVADHGEGIPEHFRHQIFTPFSQAVRGENTKIGGTGLGLAISKKLIEGMGGTIEYETEEGVGTTFRLLFDISEPRLDEISPPGSERKRPLGLHLEDDPDFAEVLRVGLEQDLQLRHASTLDEARSQLRENAFDFIIIDRAMGEENGLDLIDEIPNPETTTIIVLTAIDELIEDLRVDMTLVKSKTMTTSAITSILGLMKENA